MDDIQEIKADVKEIKTEVKVISEKLLRNTVSLEVHEYRTTLAETRLDRYESQSKWVLGLIAALVSGILLKLLFS